MEKNKDKSTNSDSLRKKAEEKLKAMEARIPLTEEDPQELMHELQTYQIELEMQNEELRRAQQELEASRTKYANLYDFAPAGYFTFDKNGLILEVNLTGAGLLGIERNLLINKPFSSFVEKDSRDVFYLHCKKVFDSSDRQTGEIRLKKKDGAEFYAQMQSIQAEDPPGNRLCRTSVIDITGRKQMEKTLQESEERYRRITEAISNYLYTVTVINGRPAETKHSEACIAVTGYTSREFAEDPYLWIRMVQEEDRDLVRKQAEEVLTGHSTKPIEHRIIRKDGKLQWVESSIVPLHDMYGSLISYDGIVRNVSERKLAEEKIKEREFELLQAQHIANIGSWTYDPLSQNPTWSEGMFHIWGLDPKLGPPHYTEHQKYIHPDDFQRFNDAVREAVEFGKPYKLELRICRPDGIEKTIISICEPQRDAAGKIVKLRGIIQDITERRKIEEQLRQAQKMEAIGVLAGGVAHDFNNILSAILGYASLLEKKIPVEDHLHTYINVIIDSSEKAADLVQNLLAFSRKRTMELKRTDLNNIVFGIHKILDRIICEDIKIKVITTAKDLIVKADKNQIEQALINLATNARDAMPQGGTLTITTEAIEIDEQFIQTHYYGEAGRYAVIKVTDTGVGMEKKTMENIFEPFFTTKEVGKGTGLGLAMVYGTIKEHEGFINVDSEPGSGTSFRIYLPLSESGAELTEEEISFPVLSGNETILIVEDDESVRKIITSVLEDFGYKVLEAVDGEDGVSVFTEHKENIQLIISDVVMPKKHGGEMLKEARKIKPDIKIIFMTGYSADFIDSKSLLEKETQFIYKPVKPDDLLRKIREVLDK